MRIPKIDFFPFVITILAIGAVFAVFGVRVWYIGALFIGAIAWWYFIRKVVHRDGKIILVVDIADGEISPYIVGRERWQNTEKIGRPIANFRTSSGSFIDVLKSYDPKKDVAIYPADETYSDIRIASIQNTYDDLIKEFVKIQKENMELTQSREISALEIARERISSFSTEINKIITPREAEKGESSDESAK